MVAYYLATFIGQLKFRNIIVHSDPIPNTLSAHSSKCNNIGKATENLLLCGVALLRSLHDERHTHANIGFKAAKLFLMRKKVLPTYASALERNEVSE